MKGSNYIQKVIVGISLAVMSSIGVYAQQPTAQIPFSASTPTIDGLVDNLWDNVSAVDINKDFSVESPSVAATWKAVWSNDGLFVLIEGNDDVWAPDWVTGNADWMSDKVELYLDFSDPQQDGMGAREGYGNYQIEPNFQEVGMNTEEEYSTGVYNNNDSITITFSSDYDGAGQYAMEYFVPADQFLIAGVDDGSLIDLQDGVVIGFDVTIADNDVDGNGRERAVWANTGSNGESWSNCDDVGLVTLTGAAEEPVAIAGEDQQVLEGQQVYLDGSASFDGQDATITTFEWTAADFLTITDADKAIANFIVPDVKKDTVFDIVLKVYDAVLNSDTDTIKVLVSRINNVPVASAGDDQTYAPGDLVVLDGSGSSDGDDDELIYRWESLSDLTLQTNNTEKVQFLAPDIEETTTYQFRLMVSDGEEVSSYDTVTISVEKASSLTGKANADKLRIQPNPSSDIATLYMEAMANPTVQVISIDGRLVEEFRLGESAVEQIRLDVTNYQTGTYIVVVTGSDKVYTSQLLVK